MKCKKCGTELRSDDEFCYRCGQRTTVFQRLFASKAIIGSGVAILIVIIAIIFTWVIMSGRLNLNALRLKLNRPDTGRTTETAEKHSSSDKNNPSGTDNPSVASSSSIEAEDASKASPTPYVFRPEDVTKTAKAEMKDLTDRIKPFLSFSASFYENNRHPFKWDNASATTAALYELYFGDKTIKYGVPYATIEKKAKKEMKALFGKYASYDFTYSGYYPDYVFVKTGDTIVYNAVRITNKSYSMKVNKILHYKENKYRVIVSACLISDTDKSKGYEQKYTLYVDRDSSAKYGFIIRKLKLYEKKDGKL